MFRIASVAILCCLSASTAFSQTVSCSNSFDKQPDPRFFGLEYAMAGHVIAEQFCGAPHIPLGPRFLDYIENSGCGPDTAIYREVAQGLATLEAGGLSFLASGGKPATMSARDVRLWAKGAAKAIGGCRKLIEMHDLPLGTVD